MRPLTTAEMRAMRGRGSYRNKYLQGVLPWQRSLRDVNVCTGNLFKSFTDVQVSPARGAGLALQRTYNSDDDRFGPFGIGWTHAYDTRNQDEQSGAITDESVNKSDRDDFFGGQHAYHRDADGLYTPPAYLFAGAASLQIPNLSSDNLLQAPAQSAGPASVTMPAYSTMTKKESSYG